MKVLLYSELQSVIGKSGIGKTRSHQKKALEMQGVSVTFDPNDAYDIAHINTVYINSRRVAKKAHRDGKPVVYHAHSTEEDFRNSFLFSNLLSPLAKKWFVKSYLHGDVIVTPTPYAKQLLEGYGIDRKIYAVSNGIDLKSFAPTPEKGCRFRERFGFSEQDHVVMSVGLYIQRKGILDFVAMANRLPQYKFIWFGHTPLYSVPSVVRKAVKTKLPNLTFAGYVPSDVLSDAYAGADLFWFPTYEETEGIVLLEALASRQNVLVRDIPIYRGWLEDNQDLYKAKDNQGFEDKICGILEGSLPDLTENGYQKAAARSLELVGGELVSIYNSLLDVK